MIKYLLILVFLCSGMSSKAQLYLQMEKSGTLKVQRFTVGDEITFKLKGEEQEFRSEYIEQILPEEKIIVFSNGMAYLEDIIALRSYQSGRMIRSVGKKMMLFGLGWGIFSLGGTALEYSLGIDTALIVGGAIITGWILQKIFPHRTYRFGKRRRLRILDLRVEPVLTP